MKLSRPYSFWKNFFHWSQFKQRSHGIFFSWTFDLPLINSSRYLLFGFYFSPHHRSIITDWIQAPKKNNHETKTRIFTCFFHEIKTNIFTDFFNIKLKTPYEQFLPFFSFPFPEEAVCRCSSKYLLLKISQYSELKKDSNRGGFFVNLSIF